MTRAAPEAALAVTRQEIAVPASAERTYRALWQADLTAARPARALAGLAFAPQRLTAFVTRAPRPPRLHPHLRDMVAPRSPWTLLADRPPRHVELGVLWRPPAGGADVASAEAFAAFDRPGFVKVRWTFDIADRPDGGCTLATGTRSVATDAGARRRFALTWPFLAVPAAMLRRLVLRAVRDAAVAGGTR